MRIIMLVQEDKHEQEIEIINKQHDEEVHKLEEKKQIITC